MNAMPMGPEPVAEAYQTLRRTLLGYLIRRVSDPEVAEDLLQEVFVKALGFQQKGSRPRHLSGWLFSVARTTLIDYYRTQKPRDELPEDLLAPEPAPEPPELAGCLRPFLRQLPPLYRDTVTALDLEGASLKELAGRWKVSIPALKSRASRGRRLLKERVLDCCRVELSATGSVLNHEKNPGTPGCEVPCGSPGPSSPG